MVVEFRMSACVLPFDFRDLDRCDFEEKSFRKSNLARQGMFDRITRKNLGFCFTFLDPEFPIRGMNVGDSNAVAIDWL